MPTVLRVGGFKFKIFPGDHDSPHVHVRYAGATAVLEIVAGTARDIQGMKDPDVRRAQRIVAEHCDELLLMWITIQAETR